MSPVSSWNWLWRYVLGAAVLALLGIRYYVDDAPLAPIAMIELGIHESSHWATIWMPRTLYFLAGSVGQVAVPLAIGAYLAFRMRDPLGGAVGLGWAGLSCHGVAVYVADAPYERLQLVGGNTHDWAYLLGPEAFDAIDAAAGLAQAVRGAGILMVVAAVAWCVAVPVLASQRGYVPRPRRSLTLGSGTPPAD